MKRVLATIVGCAFALWLQAEVQITYPDLSKPTGIAPLYFGPNALPVPDMLDGTIHDKLHVELAGDGYWGYEGDKTGDIFARLYIPLWTDRVNLAVWMPIREWYTMTPERQRTCRLQDSTIISGQETGDVYITTDIQLVRNRTICPDIALRVGLKTASGESFDKARYFDDPGYFFDVAVGKSWFLGEERQGTKDWEIRASGSAGFLCWQTDNGRQNDAVMYGLQVWAKYRYISLRTTWGGYVGWEKNGDQPMSIKARLSGHIIGLEPYVEYQGGIKDYPFNQLRVGLAYNINILKPKSDNPKN